VDANLQRLRLFFSPFERPPSLKIMEPKTAAAEL
jgi:hypothetical protein